MILPFVCLGCAALPSLLYCRNIFLYPRLTASSTQPPAVSVLIPARNEAANIDAVLASVLASREVTLECLVLDDHSTDDTAALVAEWSRRDSRVRLVSSPQLPAGWCGKQHACWELARQARHPWLLFLDADVRLAPDALGKLCAHAEANALGLLSGIPRQLTGSWLEHLLIPLIHFILLGFLPFDVMRRSRSPAFSAGCGQLLLARREAYFVSGGHREIKATLHDGLLLPRLFRERGFMTGMIDATNLATCRMYEGSRATWNGLAKNAIEGLAAPSRIGVFTALLGLGQMLPFLLLLGGNRTPAVWLACVLALVPRVWAALRFRQSWLGVVFHPFAITLLLVIQWQALINSLRGRKPQWRGRSYALGSKSLSQA